MSTPKQRRARLIKKLRGLSTKLSDNRLRKFEITDGDNCLIGKLLKSITGRGFWVLGDNGARYVTAKARTLKITGLTATQFNYLWLPNNRADTQPGAAKKIRILLRGMKKGDTRNTKIRE